MIKEREREREKERERERERDTKKYKGSNRKCFMRPNSIEVELDSGRVIVVSITLCPIEFKGSRRDSMLHSPYVYY